MNNNIKLFFQWVKESTKIVFFGGAGVSTESGIPDFRSQEGLYHLKYKYPPERILSHTFFQSNVEEFYKFYKDKMICLEARPNITHNKLAEMESEGKLKAVITQNIDGLHQMAGSKNVFELHGSVHRNYCVKCNKFYSIQTVIGSKGVPYCECGEIIKPDVVLYEEELNQESIEKSVCAIINADMLIVGGTSLSVYPASGLIKYYKGNKLVLINKEPTKYDTNANLLIQSGLGDIFSSIKSK